jgi:hypothetical protein
MKRGISRATLRARYPKRLWDFCGEWVAAIRRLTAHDIPALQGRVPSEAMEGNTVRIRMIRYDTMSVPVPAENRIVRGPALAWQVTALGCRCN